MDPVELSKVARTAAQAGAEVALQWHGRTTGREEREKSGPRDLVSRADLETEQAIRDVLARLRPDDAVLGEEAGRRGAPGGVEWLVDPIDGTTSFLYGRADWAVSVAVRDGEGELLAASIAEPSHGRLTWAGRGLGCWDGERRLRLRPGESMEEALVEVNLGRPDDHHPRAGAMVGALLPRIRDLRRGGSAASSLAALAGGRADAVWSPGLQPWDGAAGVLLVTEAGGVVGDLAGEVGARWPLSGDVLAAPSALWEPLRRVLEPVYAAER